MLRAEGSEGWLRFPPLVRDFRLRVELRFLTDNADSGVFFRALPDGAFARGWPNRSYQVQLLNPAAGGSCRPSAACFATACRPARRRSTGRPFAARSRGPANGSCSRSSYEGAELTVQLNGMPVTKASGIADVAGYIGIQSETSAVEFRRIDIEVIDSRAEVTNPYERVDWATFSHHRADLHVHTLQSDGCHHLEEVVRVYRAAGFSILSITDHDAMAPNACPTREATPPENIRFGFFTETPSPYPNPRPANFPAETTWPWNAFGAPSPTELGMVGIEGAELTCGHHINSYFNDYGVQPPCRDAPAINEWLHEVARRNGIAVINHPEPRFREWYIELYRVPFGELSRWHRAIARR